VIIFHQTGTFREEMSNRVNQEAWISYGGERFRRLVCRANERLTFFSTRSFAGLCIMVVVSIGPVRRRWYHIFKAGHHGGLVLFLAGMNYHSSSFFLSSFLSMFPTRRSSFRLCSPFPTETVLPFLLLAIFYIALNYLYRFMTSNYRWSSFL